MGVGARETTVLVAPRSCRLAGTACVLYSAARCPGRAQAAASLAPGTPPPDDQRGTARDTGRQREARVQPCANRSPLAPPQAHPGSRECPAWPRPAAVAVGRLRPGRRHSRQPSQKIQKPGRPALSSVLYLFFQFSTYSKSQFWRPLVAFDFLCGVLRTDRWCTRKNPELGSFSLISFL